MKNKIRAMFMGVGIGDCLGLPYECKTYPYSFSRKYLSNIWSDDCFLTLSVAASLIDSGKIDIYSQIERHVEAYKISTYGWGSTTRGAIKQLSEGKLLEEVEPCGKGTGNGVVMKMAPVAAFLATLSEEESIQEIPNIVKLGAITHPSRISIVSGVCHAFALKYCLEHDTINKSEFLDYLTSICKIGNEYLDDDGVDYIARLNILKEPIENILETFDYGTPYAYNSAPFSYAFFLKNPHDPEIIYEVAASGGDTDSNAAIVASMYGALNGMKFPKDLLRDLNGSNIIWDWANKFCDRFGID